VYKRQRGLGDVYKRQIFNIVSSVFVAEFVHCGFIIEELGFLNEETAL
jgi:hypothetical protein